MPKERTKPKKRGPKEERPSDVASLKAEFDAVHEKGTDALRRHDYDALKDAVRREAEIVEAMGAVIRRKRVK